MHKYTHDGHTFKVTTQDHVGMAAATATPILYFHEGFHFHSPVIECLTLLPP